MHDSARLIDRIYEASVLIERWPSVLQDIADRAGAKGATIMTRSPDIVSSIASPAIQDDVEDFVAQGWGRDTEFVAPLFAEQWPGFRTEIDYRSSAEIAALPVHSEFLDPRGYIAGAATVIQGAGNCLIHTAIEGFSSHAAATGAINFLDGLRPHLARAISLTALRTDRSRVVVDSLNMGGVAAAVIGKSGRLRSVNDLFVGQMGSRMIDGVLGLRFTDQHLTDQLRAALQKIGQGEGGVQSIAMRGGDGLQPFAIHLLPIIGAAREVCDSDGILMLISEASNTSTPSADLLRLLFDLTPSEARVARHLMTGGTIVSAGKALGIGDGTVRSHLKGVFAKTRVNRQADLMRLLAAYGPPTSRS